MACSAEMEVPNGSFVSFLIGKGGVSIVALQRETHCQLDIPNDKRASLATVRRITVRGRSAEAVAAGEKAVRERLRAFHARMVANGDEQAGAAAAAAAAMAGSGATAASDDDEEALCVICLDAPKTHLLLPCGHKCVCAGCAPDYAPNDGDGWQRVGPPPQCPMCRGAVSWVARVWE